MMLKQMARLARKLLQGFEIIPSLILGLLLSACVAKGVSPTQERDTSPDAFMFNEEVNAALSNSVQSNTVVISGINTATPITIKNGQFAIDGGSFRSSATNIFAGQSVQVQLQSAATPSTMQSAILTIGDVQASFTVTTKAGSAPIARAGEDQAIALEHGQNTATVTLDSSASHDEENDIVRAEWQLAGATIASTEALTATTVMLGAGEHIIRLTLTDSENHSATDELLVRVTPPPLKTTTAWLTRGDQSALLARTDISTSPSDAAIPPAMANITVNAEQRYQFMEGFGFALTQGAALAIAQLDEHTQGALLHELFDPTEGNSIDVLRVPLGASDLSTSLYSFNSHAGDTAMQHFSLEGPDLEYKVPLLKKILAINPELKLMATPWSAPPWMKDNQSWVGGHLKPEYYAAYARYFVKYFDAMAAHGITFWALSPQNEPLHPHNEPSMEMFADEQLAFIEHHLGPALANSPHSLKILAYDHNCDRPDYAETVANGSQYVSGSAFHLYGGDISALTDVKNNTGKDVYFTEQWTGAAGSFDGDFGWHMENIVIGATRNWARTVIEWNIASTPPSQARGCLDCQGALAIDENSGQITRHVSYYIIAQAAKFVDANAQRIASSSDNNNLHHVAFQNPDNSRVLLVYNPLSDEQVFWVNGQTQQFEYTLPGRSAVTFDWE